MLNCTSTSLQQNTNMTVQRLRWRDGHKWSRCRDNSWPAESIFSVGKHAQLRAGHASFQRARQAGMLGAPG